MYGKKMMIATVLLNFLKHLEIDPEINSGGRLFVLAIICNRNLLTELVKASFGNRP